jgi:hypothetical protein
LAVRQLRAAVSAVPLRAVVLAARLLAVSAFLNHPLAVSAASSARLAASAFLNHRPAVPAAAPARRSGKAQFQAGSNRLPEQAAVRVASSPADWDNPPAVDWEALVVSGPAGWVNLPAEGWEGSAAAWITTRHHSAHQQKET